MINDRCVIWFPLHPFKLKHQLQAYEDLIELVIAKLRVRGTEIRRVPAQLRESDLAAFASTTLRHRLASIGYEASHLPG